VKNQYFADRRDFFKYDLLLRPMGCGLGFDRLVMAWWLTADDDSGDGEVRDYTAGGLDRALHDWLQLQHDRSRRDVRRPADCPSLRDAPWEYQPILETVPDDPSARAGYVLTVEAAARAPSGISRKMAARPTLTHTPARGKSDDRRPRSGSCNRSLARA
jgi:hypothetical protein